MQKMKISELKKDAKQKLSGKYFNAILIYVIYALITCTLLILSEFLEGTLSIILNIIQIVITFPLAYGVVASIIKLSRNEEVHNFDFFKLGMNNFKKVWKVYFRTFLKLIVPIILIFISIFGIGFIIGVGGYYSININENTAELPDSIAIFLLIALALMFISLIWLLIKSLSYSLNTYLIYDNPESSSKEIVEKSAKLMKGNKGKFILLNLSFFGWYLLIGLVIGLLTGFISEDSKELISTCALQLGTSLLLPYIEMTIINFYEALNTNIE